MAILKQANQDLELSPDQQAVRWHLRLRRGTLSQPEQQEFEAWSLNPAHAAALARARRLWSAVDEVSARPEILQLRETILSKVNRRRYYFSTAVAAGVAIFLIAGSALLGRIEPAIYNPDAPFALALAPSEGRFTTTVGERSTVTLRDGSILTLNTASAARVNYSDTERGITLERGQALFEVAKGEPRPFVVYAGDRRIVATGTAFDVRLSGSDIEVTLVEGHVQVDQALGAGDSAQGSRKTNLQAGERLVARAGTAVSVSNADTERVTSWTAGKLIFLDTRLADAVAEANRYTRAPISLVGDGLADLRINGVFRAGQSAEFARAVVNIHPLKLDYLSDGQIRLRAN